MPKKKSNLKLKKLTKIKPNKKNKPVIKGNPEEPLKGHPPKRPPYKRQKKIKIDKFDDLDDLDIIDDSIEEESSLIAELFDNEEDILNNEDDEIEEDVEEILPIKTAVVVKNDIKPIIEEKKRRGPKTKKTEHYVDANVLKDNIKKFYKSNELNDELAEMVAKIARRLAYAPNFINYSFREEFIGDAIIKMMQALKNKKFDPEKGNPFSYFTKIAFNAFRNRIKKEKRTHDALQTYQENVFNTLQEHGYIPSPNNNKSIDGDDEHPSDNHE